MEVRRAAEAVAINAAHAHQRLAEEVVRVRAEELREDAPVLSRPDADGVIRGAAVLSRIAATARIPIPSLSQSATAIASRVVAGVEPDEAEQDVLRDGAARAAEKST
jgi:hypothetical protein